MIDDYAGSLSVGAAPARSEERMLLDEANHRAANEVAAALAAMRLAADAQSGHARRSLMAAAIDRLEGFGDSCRLLSAPIPGITDAGALLDRICKALARARSGDGPRSILLNLCEAIVPGELARRICLVAHELVTNALKHARGGRELEIRLERLCSHVVLSVIDDGPGMRPERPSPAVGTRLGGGIVGELVRSVGGSLECESGPGGTAIHVTLPLRPDSCAWARHA